MSTDSVTVLGLGPMGRALAGAFLDGGLRVTVWNRTPGREGDLTGRGALTAGSVAEAVTAGDIVVVCVVNYDAADGILRPNAVALSGRTLVNLTADTPGRARETADWAERHGIGYLDGAIMTPAATVGTPGAVFLHSGPEDLYQRRRPVLERLGGTHTYLGADPGRAAAYDIALLDVFWTAMTGYAHALALAGAEGISGREMAPFAAGIASILPPIFTDIAGRVDDGDFTGDDNPITSALSSMSHIAETAESNGIDAAVMRSAEDLLRRAVDRGHGADGFARMTEVMLGRH